MPAGLSLAANLTSAATFIISPRLIYLYGLSGVLGYVVAMPLGLFLGLIVFSAGASLLQIAFLVLITVGLTRVPSNVLAVPMWVSMAIALGTPQTEPRRPPAQVCPPLGTER